GASIGNLVALQGDRAGLRDGSAAQDCGAGIEGYAVRGDDISFEGSTRTERRGAADLPKQANARTTVDHVNSRIAGGREGTPNLENEERILVALGIEIQ